MGELSEQKQALQESLNTALKLVSQNRNQGHGSYGDLTRAEWHICNALDTLNNFVAPSEGQPSPGYAGGKSLGERLYEAEFVIWSVIPLWKDLRPSTRDKYDRAAVTFTASLSGGEERLGAIPEPARLDLNGPSGGEEFLEFKEALDVMRKAATEAMALYDVSVMAAQFTKPGRGQVIVNVARAEKVMDGLRAALLKADPANLARPDKAASE